MRRLERRVLCLLARAGRWADERAERLGWEAFRREYPEGLPLSPWAKAVRDAAKMAPAIDFSADTIRVELDTSGGYRDRGAAPADAIVDEDGRWHRPEA